jgi:type I restriction enzyme R subunit
MSCQNFIQPAGTMTRSMNRKPALIIDEKIDDEGNTIESKYEDLHENDSQEDTSATSCETPTTTDDSEGEPGKYYVNGSYVEIIADVVYELDSDGKRLAPIKYTDYTQKQVRSMYTSASELRSKWSDAEKLRANKKDFFDRFGEEATCIPYLSISS